MQLSKSDYMLYLKHPAWLWLKKNDKEKLPPIDANTQAMFDSGYEFESYAEQLFPGAVKIGWSKNNYGSFNSMIARTKEALASDVNTLLQGRLESGEINSIFDVLARTGDNTFNLYEIKSSTSVKEDHKHDLAFQVEVIEGNGYKIGNIFVIHVNNEYVRSGDIDVKDITRIVDVTDSVKKLKSFTKSNIKKAIRVAKQKECPKLTPANFKMGPYSEWMSIYNKLAEFDEFSIYNLASTTPKIIKDLEALGIKNIGDIPENYPLNDKQRNQVYATKHDKIIVEKTKISKFLKKVKFPLYFLDYETLASVIPFFDGLGPYKQLPFQYSLHVLDSPGGKLQHYEYLHKSNISPIIPLTKSLKSHIGDKGTIFVWFENFEKNCNNLMGSINPEYKKFYEDVNSRIIDLMTPFANGHYVHKNFFGSSSIKKVLPALIPELSYKDLDIHEGGAAQRLWMDAILHGKRDNEKDKILADLLKYCELDTLAMVRIYEFLANIDIQEKAKELRLF